MSRNRQNGWTVEEDELLAHVVLTYIREGNTQLEAFKDAAKQLSRTAAACGFRWNASVRKEYETEILEAKQSRKGHIKPKASHIVNQIKKSESHPVDLAISLLEKMKETETIELADQHDEDELEQLKRENTQLKKLLKLYHDGWTEMGKVWQWIESQHEEE